MLTSETVSNLSSTGVFLSGSFNQATSVPVSAGFEYGTSESSLNKSVTVSASSGVEGEFSTTLSGLEEGTTYYYRAFVTVNGTGDYASQSATVYGDTYSFTTKSVQSIGSSNAALGQSLWLEMPAASTMTGLNQSAGYSSSCHVETIFEAADESNDENTVRDRNYSYHYDKTTYTSLWVAYPLYGAVMGGSNTASWKTNPSLNTTSEQINVWSGSYGVNVGSTTSADYTDSKDYYARGHQIPNADRKNNSSMNSQTYYATNSTPQIQNGFNGGIWSSLENAVRTQASNTDTLYVVTGASFRKVGGSEDITYITPQHDSKQCPVPNYYWKVLLKVEREGNNVSSASAIGFWFEHKTYSGDNYSNYAVSVNQIEQWTGFDFFVNLPDSVEETAEQNANWNAF